MHGILYSKKIICNHHHKFFSQGTISNQSSTLCFVRTSQFKLLSPQLQPFLCLSSHKHSTQSSWNTFSPVYHSKNRILPPKFLVIDRFSWNLELGSTYHRLQSPVHTNGWMVGHCYKGWKILSSAKNSIKRILKHLHRSKITLWDVQF